MLNNIEAERQVIGAIIKDPWPAYNECLRQGVSRETFFDHTCRLLWEEFTKLDNIQQAENIAAILYRSSEEGTSNLSGEATSMLKELLDWTYIFSNIPKILTCHSDRKKHSHGQQFLKALEDSNDVEANEHLAEINHESKRPDGKLDALLSSRRYDETIPPKDNPPIAYLNHTGVIWKGNIHTLVAGSKVGKSRFLAAMIKSMVKGSRSLGWSDDRGGKKVIYLDFEQDHEDFYNSMHDQAGVSKDEVYAYNLAGVAANDAIACVEAALAQHPADSLLVDGIADLCNDVNDPEESNALVARLMALAVEYDIAIVGVLHLNPGSDVKSRGHLGSQLERKSKTIIQIDCDEDDIRTVYTKLARKKPISKKDGVRFQWCDMAGNFVELTETKSQEQQRLEGANLREMMTEILSSRTIKEFSHKELVGDLMTHTDKGASTAKTMIKKMIDYGILTKSSGEYALIKTELKALKEVN